MKEVKEASYYDSIQLFKIGQEALLKTQNTSDKGAVAEIYFNYGNYFYFIHDFDRSKAYFIKAISEAQRTGNRHIQDFAGIRLSFVEYELGLNDQIEDDLAKWLTHSKKINDYENTAEVMNLMGIIYEEQNRIKEAAKLYLDELAFAELHGLIHYLGVSYNNLGLIKLYADQMDDALIDFQKAMDIAVRENDTRLLNHVRINICLIYLYQNKTEKALQLFGSALDYARTNNHPRELGSTFVNMGGVFMSTGKYDQALPYMDSAIAVFRFYRMDYELTKSYLAKAEALVTMKNFAGSQQNLDSAQTIIKRTGRLEDNMAYYMIAYQKDYGLGDYKASVDNYVSFIKLKDSLDKKINGKLIQQLQLKYNVQKKESELERERSRSLLLEKQSQEERFMKWLWIGGSSVALVLIIGFVWLRYSRKLREKQAQFSRLLIQNIEEERSRISQDLHDDIGQSLSILKSKIAVKPGEYDPGLLEAELGRVIEQTRDISRSLYPTYLEKIGLTRSVARLAENIQEATNIECSFDITPEVEDLPVNIKTHLYRIIQECTNNTVKHAGASALKISILGKTHDFQMVYQDNGQGVDPKNKGDGMGLLSIRERAKIINGTASIEEKNDRGFRLFLKFKYAS